MKILVKLMEEIEEISKVSFSLKKMEVDIYTSPNFIIENKYVQRKIKISSEELILQVSEEDEKVLPLLESTIINSIKTLNHRKLNIIMELIEGKNIEEEELKRVYPFLMREFGIIYIYTERNFEEVFSIAQNGYTQEEIIVMEYNNNVLVLGELDDIYEHAESLFGTITSNVSGKVIISYCNLDKYSKLHEMLKISLQKIELVKKYNLSMSILGSNDLIFEEMVDSINQEKKKSLINRFYQGFTKLDNEMLKTIEVFFDCGLNLSEGAKELYVHRNTLIYRLDKLTKYTGFDIRDFNQAALFKVIFVLFKEEKNKKNQKN